MTYFECTAWAFVTFSTYLIPILIMLLGSFYVDKVIKPITRFRANLIYLLLLIYVSVVYYGTFAHFFFGVGMLPENNAIKLGYLFPERDTVLNIADIIDVKTEPSYKGNFQMIIKMKDGKKYEGAPSNKLDVDNKVKFVKAALTQ